MAGGGDGENESAGDDVSGPQQQNQSVDKGETALPDKKLQSWQRRKQELHSLGRQAREMQSQVALLKLQHGRRCTRQGLSPQSMEELRRCWEETTEEKQRWLAVQRENRTLKEQLRSCARTLNELQAALTTASLQTQLTKATIVSTTDEAPEVHFCNARTFNVLESRVDKRVHEIPTILAALQQTPSAVDSVEVQMYAASGCASAAMEYKCAQTLPFDEVAMSNAVWGVADVGRVAQKQLSQVVRRSPDAYAVWSHFKLRLEGGEILTADVHSVMKRYAVAGGILMLAESTTDWTASHAGSSLWSHVSRDSMWFVARRRVLGSGNATGYGPSPPVGCQVNAVVRSEVTRLKAIHEASADHCSRHATVMPFYRQMIDSQRQYLENTLWDSVRVAPSNDETRGSPHLSREAADT